MSRAYMSGTINRFTPQQSEVINGITNPMVSAKGSQYGETIEVVSIVDDTEISCWTIEPDGTYFVESLESLGGGWNRSEGGTNE